MSWRSRAMGRQTSAGWGKQAIFELNASLARWRWRLQHYFLTYLVPQESCAISQRWPRDARYI